MNFLSPKNEVAFIRVFGSQEQSEILISFLNAVLDLTGDKEIQSLRILDSRQIPILKPLKMTILDVQVVDKRNVSFIVELQIEHTLAVRKHFLYYTDKAYASRIERGAGYPQHNQIILIAILDFNLFENSIHYLNRYHVLNTITYQNQQEVRELEFNFIELPKFNKNAGDIKTALDEWLYFLKYAKEIRTNPAHVTMPELHQAYQLVDPFWWSEEELNVFDYRAMRIQDERGVVAYAEREGFRKGFEKAMTRTALAER